MRPRLLASPPPFHTMRGWVGVFSTRGSGTNQSSFQMVCCHISFMSDAAKKIFAAAAPYFFSINPFTAKAQQHTSATKREKPTNNSEKPGNFFLKMRLSIKAFFCHDQARDWIITTRPTALYAYDSSSNYCQGAFSFSLSRVQALGRAHFNKAHFWVGWWRGGVSVVFVVGSIWVPGVNGAAPPF